MSTSAVVRRQRSIVISIIAIFVGVLGVPHLVEGIRGRGDPRLLRLEHLDVAIFSFVAAYAMWTEKRWASWALTVAGAATAILVVSLGPLLEMDSVARSGLWIGAASIALMTAIGVWLVARRTKRASS
jgi:hypothetical protein